MVSRYAIGTQPVKKLTLGCGINARGGNEKFPLDKPCSSSLKLSGKKRWA
jgi:hypothetical protein